MNLKSRKVFTSKFVGTGPSSYEKKNLPGRGLTKVEKHWLRLYVLKRVSCGPKFLHCIFSKQRFCSVFGAQTPSPVGQGLLIHEVSRSHIMMHHSR